MNIWFKILFIFLTLCNIAHYIAELEVSRRTEIERIEKKIKQDTLKDREELKILKKLNKDFLVKYDKNYVNKRAESN